MARTVLETNAVTKTYHVGDNTIWAVDEVSVSVAAGEFVALVGPSGSGKTTMLAMLAGLLSPTEGSILIDDNELSKMGEAQLTRFRRDKIGFTFQTNNLVPYLTVLENVELMLRLTGQSGREDRKRARDTLVRLGLEDHLSNLPSQLSGGQKQRVAIARSLIHRPKIVLADEPTSSLDTERAYQVVEIFANMVHNQDLAGIMVTHDLRMCRYADKIIQMRDGKIDQILTGENEIDDFATAYQ